MDQQPAIDAESYLMEGVYRGDPHAWRQLIERYRKRLLAFACARVDQSATAEDLVQETFVNLLEALPRLRGVKRLETLLFTILRRRVVDHYRRTGTARVRSIEPLESSSSDGAVIDDRQLEPDEWLLATEAASLDFEMLADAIEQVCGQIRKQTRFFDLQIIEAIFFAAMTNAEVSQRLGVDGSDVASRKKRLLDRLQTSIEEHPLQGQTISSRSVDEDLWRRVWQSLRPSCPKRSVLGKYLLGLLPIDWHDYVRFHCEVIRCEYCAASLAEFQSAQNDADAQRLSQRLFQSTINFLPLRRALP